MPRGQLTDGADATVEVGHRGAGPHVAGDRGQGGVHGAKVCLHKAAGRGGDGCTAQRLCRAALRVTLERVS